MNLRFFPYPIVYQGRRQDGAIIPWPEVCNACLHRNCERSSEPRTRLCSYGLNYQRVDDDLLVAGVVLRDFQLSSQQRKKRRRALPVVPNEHFQRAIEAYRVPIEERMAAERERLEEAQQDLLDEEQFKVDYLYRLRKDILRGLSFFHDYKQINAQIKQNINVVIEERYAGGDLEEKLAQATRAERAIYEGARFLTEKLNVAKFLVDPGWLKIADECRKFRVHGMVHKYIKLYQSWFDAQEIVLREMGTSHNEIVANPDASGVIAHTLMDNALKYAPTGSEVQIFMEDRDGGVYFDVASFGPALEKGEERSIFRPFYRGMRAKEIVSDGAGYGLYISQLIASEHFGTTIDVEQDCTRSHGDRCWTTFSIHLPPRAAVVE